MRFNLRSCLARFAFAIALPFVALSFAAVPAHDAYAQQMPAGAKQPGDFPRVKLTAGMFVIDAAVAANDADREQGTDIDEMQAETTNNHCPRNNGVYALEMSKGWFDAKGIKPGMKLQGLPAAQ